MKRTTILTATVALLLLVLSVAEGLISVSPYRALGIVLAQTGGPYDLTWSTADGGGYTFSSGGNYTLGGTIGQPDAGTM